VEAARLVGQRNIFPGQVVGHEAGRSITHVAWRERPLEVRLQSDWAPGTDIAWLIPPSKVVLHRRDRPSRGEAENPVSGTIASFIALGDTMIASVKLDGAETRLLTFHVPRHVADRNKLGVGEHVTLSLLAEAIHLMPAAKPRTRRP
jgi:molybdate transport system ATP-binding protein